MTHGGAKQEATSLFKEVGDSAETACHSDMYATSEMASRWKEIHWLQIDKRCWGGGHIHRPGAGVPELPREFWNRVLYVHSKF
jgi:hypothetical protein